MNGERRERFSDEELAFLRYARFGELPGRVRPEDRLELTETDAARDRPEPAGNDDEWILRLGAGG
ncbi:hypothetical protein [Micromonospora sonneratiae]|uniref:Uncharacterized protein n=1 Tax=Micromonospora sonneratiae TaxID=1184706 RepID=A0ABW3YE42_9ACTN